MSVLGMDPAELRLHAARVDVLAEEPRSALEAARTTAADHDAFGVLCSFLVPLLAGTQLTGIAACATTVGSLATAATEVRSVAAGIEATDVAVAATATGLSRTVDGVREQAWPAAAGVVETVAGAAQATGEELVRGTVRQAVGAVVEAAAWLDRLEGSPVSPVAPPGVPVPVGVPVGVPAPGAEVAP
ncbi:hypothetical protein QE364_002963 [Nocardioides zeae]|uniref:Uncharacterized protein n=1 Tax=Nocardioides zeae TaxID=1457234 RepID=A0ACC6IKU5_9ACTN|nr:hypothetical protein [Nocardioides zeae]MDR6175266.1 hypothetical protein [Nocardioides zeae]MDR6211242.1 hypothetical protein [Nocardioides zeae]